MADKYTRPVADGRGLWWTERLWALAAELPVISVKLADIPEFEQDCWFVGRHVPTIREVAKHAQRIAQADPAYPVILCAEGRLMDGGHRVAKAWMAGQDEIIAVRFPVTPEPDEILPEG
ncbi:MAG: hypothetical protein Q7T84_09540 [Phenylobacterium sp.]|uniref:hypothetical protein n=1 Tax=Phenylobacterium sp. TaxID=1871053 RepID=UPI0027204823|nr:hypothetical protein [Phenylobacterium sp.]MDO9431533.1 hypothetical protein [Phenylobacterium sp.]